MQDLKLLQSQNLNLAKEIFKLAGTIDKLPKGGNRSKLEARRDNLIQQSKSVEAMETPQVALPYQGPFGEGSYGYGLSIAPDFLGHKLVGHGGSVLVATA